MYCFRLVCVVDFIPKENKKEAGEKCHALLSRSFGTQTQNVTSFWDSDAHPRTPHDASSCVQGSGHLLMQQLAVSFDVSVKTGLSVGWPKISRVNLLTMSTIRVGIG